MALHCNVNTMNEGKSVVRNNMQMNDLAGKVFFLTLFSKTFPASIS